MIAIKIILILILVYIFYQDYKDREVYWFLFPSVLVCSSILFYSSTLPELFVSAVILNLLFVILLLTMAFLYTRLKLKIKFNQVFGLGDVLLFVALAFTFSTISFLSVFVFGLFCALVLHQALKRYSHFKTVPLAGYLSLYFALVYLSVWSGLSETLYTI